jgi:predicted transcriptional regulator
MANNTKFTAVKRDKYLGCLRSGMRRGEAARRAGVTRWTVTNHMKADPEFAAACDLAEADACDLVEDSMLEAIKKGNVTAMVFWLMNRSQGRWVDKRQPTVVVPSQPQDLEKVKDELLKKLKELPEDK